MIVKEGGIKKRRKEGEIVLNLKNKNNKDTVGKTRRLNFIKSKKVLYR